MASFRLWIIRVLAFIHFFSHMLCHPLNPPRESSWQVAHNQTETFTLVDSLLELEKRAPPALRKFNTDEMRLNRKLALSINTRLRDGDCIWFIGNSGTYLGLPFDQTKYNMRSIPMSSSKRYGQPSFRPSETGLARYFDVFLRPMMQVPITRFVLIDHSSTGKSVDGFRRAFLDMVYYYGLEQGATPEGAQAGKTFYAKIPMVLINIVDYNRREHGPRPVIDPESVPVDAIYHDGGPGEVNKMVGDEKNHDRVTANYPPEKWHISDARCWGSKTISPINEYTNGRAMRADIVDWNKRHYHLITPDSPGPDEVEVEYSSKPGKKKDRKPPSWAKKMAPWAFPPPKGKKYTYI